MPAFRLLSAPARGAIRGMSSRSTPRSATDATRFTSTTPQPKSKASSGPAGKGRGGAPGGETLEQRVQRLRAAHQAARAAPLSVADRVADKGRKVFDVMHKVTLVGLIGFTVVAGVFSVYAVIDMLKFNRKRREDFVRAQQKIASDAFQSARLAFVNGTATEEQTRLVEEAIQDAERAGTKLPPLLSEPAGAPPAAEEAGSSASLWDKVDAQVKAEGGAVAEKAQGVLERERENQRRGGPLDKLGLEEEGKKEGSKRWWWPW